MNSSSKKADPLFIIFIVNYTIPLCFLNIYIQFLVHICRIPRPPPPPPHLTPPQPLDFFSFKFTTTSILGSHSPDHPHPDPLPFFNFTINPSAIKYTILLCVLTIDSILGSHLPNKLSQPLTLPQWTPPRPVTTPDPTPRPDLFVSFTTTSILCSHPTAHDFSVINYTIFIVLLLIIQYFYALLTIDPILGSHLPNPLPQPLTLPTLDPDPTRPPQTVLVSFTTTSVVGSYPTDHDPPTFCQFHNNSNSWVTFTDPPPPPRLL